MVKLMQGSIRDFSISTLLKNICQNKAIIVGCHLKTIDNQGHSVDKEQYTMGEKTYINV